MSELQGMKIVISYKRNVNILSPVLLLREHSRDMSLWKWINNRDYYDSNLFNSRWSVCRGVTARVPCADPELLPHPLDRAAGSGFTWRCHQTMESQCRPPTWWRCSEEKRARTPPTLLCGPSRAAVKGASQSGQHSPRPLRWSVTAADQTLLAVPYPKKSRRCIQRLFCCSSRICAFLHSAAPG